MIRCGYSDVNVSNNSTTQFNKFKERRVDSWFFKEKPFNPKEHWRKRKVRLVSPFQTQTQAFYGSSISVQQGHLACNITKLNTGWTAFIPKIFQNNSHFMWSIPQLHYPTLHITRRWLNAVAGFVGRRIAMRLRYKGKSFRWHRKLNAILLRFGHSHVVLFKPEPNIKWRKHGRMKIIFFGTSLWSLKKTLQSAVRWRPMNIYHGRGLRLAQQKVLRKSGKVSAYR